MLVKYCGSLDIIYYVIATRFVTGSQYVLYREYLNHEHSGVLTFYQFNHRSTKSDVLLDLALVALQNITNIVDVIGIACGRHRGNTMQGLTIVFQCPNDVYQKCMKREINDFMMYTRVSNDICNISNYTINVFHVLHICTHICTICAMYNEKIIFLRFFAIVVFIHFRGW